MNFKRSWVVSFYMAVIILVTSLLMGISAPSGPSVQFSLDGSFNFQTNPTAATNTIKYRTAGFYVSLVPSKDYNGSGYNPNELYKDGKAGVIYVSYDDECSQYNNGDGTVKFSCLVPKNDCDINPDYQSINDALKEAGLDYISDGQPVYVSAFFMVSDSTGHFPGDDGYPPFVPGYAQGKTSGTTKTYNNLDQIQSAESWAHPEDFVQYYDKITNYKGDSKLIVVYVKQGTSFTNINECPYNNISAGLQASSYVSGSGILDVEDVPATGTSRNPATGNWIPGSAVSQPLKTTVPKNGVTYNIVGSYFTHRGKNWTKLYPVGPTVTTRNITVASYPTYIVVEMAPDTTTPPPSGLSACAPPSKISQKDSPAASMLANPSGVLKADARGAEQFDVSQGIPVTESLYANLFGKNFLADYSFGQYKGTCTWQIQVTKTYNFSYQTYQYDHTNPCTPQTDGSCTGGGPVYSCKPASDTVPVTQTYEVKRYYTYWALDQFRTYELKSGSIWNYALSGGGIKLTPNYSPPSADADKLGTWQQHIQEPDVQTTLTLPSQSVGPSGTDGNGCAQRAPTPSENWQTNAENQVKQVKVWNDLVKWDGQTIMDNSHVDTTAPTPSDLPAPTQIGSDVLYKSGLVIPASKQNSANNASTGQLVYTSYVSVDSPADVTVPVPGINSVTIHTPVVNYTVMPDENRPFDQSVVQDNSRISLVLGRNFTITFGNTGQHLNYPGYGNRSYTKYTAEKRVMFPFDVYYGSTFYPANTWIDYPVNSYSEVFKVPEWVNEGNYTVRTESWAVNDSSGRNSSLCQMDFNGTISNYCAAQTVNVKVIGRVYGFRVYDIGDFRYETLFRTAKGSTQSTGFQYYSGARDKDGLTYTYSNQPQRLLPVRPGSLPGQVATTPHNGYPFLFFFNTIGNYWNVGEGVKITPNFYFVSDKGTNPVPVDLYYDTTNAKMVKVGSSVDQQLFTRKIALGDPLRNVDKSYIDAAATYEYNNFLTAATKATTSLSKFISQAEKRSTVIGHGYKDITLGYQMRTLVGNVDSSLSVPDTTQARGVQRWFAEYNLPIAPYVVAKGTDLEALARTKYHGSLDGTEPEFMKHGYIIVNFTIQTYRNSDPNTPVLAYDASGTGGANMWKIEQQIQSSTSYLGAKFNYHFGDIIMFESDFSVRDDYGVTK